MAAKHASVYSRYFHVLHMLVLERVLFEKHFQSAGHENYFLCVYPQFTSKIINLVISLVNAFAMSVAKVTKSTPHWAQ